MAICSTSGRGLTKTTGGLLTGRKPSNSFERKEGVKLGDHARVGRVVVQVAWDLLSTSVGDPAVEGSKLAPSMFPFILRDLAAGSSTFEGLRSLSGEGRPVFVIRVASKDGEDAIALVDDAG